MSAVDSVADKPRVPRELPVDERSPAGDRDLVDRPEAASPRDTARPADGLRQRMDHLPAGHPSSPYEADGRLRQPTPRLRDVDPADQYPADQYKDSDRAAPDPTSTGDTAKPPDASDNTAPDATDAPEPTYDGRPPPDIKPSPDDESPPDSPRVVDQTRPLTDAEWADHVADVRARLDKAQLAGLSTQLLSTIDEAKKIWSDERDLIHDSIIEAIYAKAGSVPCESKAIVAGGLAGAGKTTILGEYAGIDLSQYLTINPDHIKEELAIRGLIPEVEGLTPMEASDLVHEESSHIAKRIARRAEADGKNVVWDITMSARGSTEDRIGKLRTAGYAVDGIFIDVSIKTSILRADARHREGHEDYRSGKGSGGRYVPPEVTEARADPDWDSKNRKIFEQVKHRFDHWSRYDNSVDGRRALLTETSQSDDKGSEEKAS